MFKSITSSIETKQDFAMSLDEIARTGARELLVRALGLEVEDYIDRHSGEVNERGHRLVVRNGLSQERSVTLGCGEVKLRTPRIDDRREGKKFSSSILPSYLRKSPKVDSLLPILYLKGLSTSDFESALSDILGDGSRGLSPASIVKLKTLWEKEYAQWKTKPITDDIVYLWVDGVNVSVRLGEDRKICLLVVIGATSSGEKKLLSVHPGYRESKESWLCVLTDLKARGLKDPMLAIGDGALGFWSALRTCEGYLNTKEQRCWVHKIANVLDKMPKRTQPHAKSLLHDMMRAEDLKSALVTRTKFENLYLDKYPQAIDCLVKDWDTLTTFFSFPAAQWISIRTTNPIESAFATVKLRTRVTKGAGSTTAAVTMAFKLLCECEKKWRVLRGAEQIKYLREGLEFQNGIVIPKNSHHEVAAS
jgi:transposase-like protein